MLTGKGAIIERMVRAAGFTPTSFCKAKGLKKKTLDQAVYMNVVTEDLVEALESVYGGDYSWLIKEDGRCTKSTKRRRTN